MIISEFDDIIIFFEVVLIRIDRVGELTPNGAWVELAEGGHIRSFRRIES